MISKFQYQEMARRAQSRRHAGSGIPIRIEPVVGKESDLHDEIIDYCKNRGWFYVHSRMDKPTTTACGVTDFIIARDDGRTLWIECKRKNGKLTPHQQGVVHWLERSKQIVAVVYSLEDFIAVSKRRE